MATFAISALGLLVSLAAVFIIVTQRSSPQTFWGGALRDDTKNGCEGDYRVAHWIKHAKGENVIAFTIAVEKVYVSR